MGKRDKQTTTQNQVIEPYGPSEPLLQLGLDRLDQLYQADQLTPQVFGSRLAPESSQTLQARQMITQQAEQGSQAVPMAQEAFGSLAGGDPYARLDTLRENALRQSLPHVASMYEDSGMLASSVAQEGLAEAAARAIAPIEYDAYNQDRNRQLSALSLAPEIAGLEYFDGQILADQGALLDRRLQSEVDDRAALFYEGQDRDYQDLLRLSETALGFGAAGGTQSGRNVAQQRPGTLTTIGGLLQPASLLGGLFGG